MFLLPLSPEIKADLPSSLRTFILESRTNRQCKNIVKSHSVSLIFTCGLSSVGIILISYLLQGYLHVTSPLWLSLPSLLLCSPQRVNLARVEWLHKRNQKNPKDISLAVSKILPTLANNFPVVQSKWVKRKMKAKSEAGFGQC